MGVYSTLKSLVTKSTSFIGSIYTKPVNWQTAFNPDYEAEMVTSVFTSVKILSSNISRLTPRVIDTNNKKTKHYLNTILGIKPNPIQNKQIFWGIVEANRCVHGNAFVYIKRGINGKAESLWIINNDAITTASISPNNNRLYYTVNWDLVPLLSTTGTESVSADNILHFRFASNNSVFSRSPLEALVNYTSILARATKMIEHFYGNNATSALAIETTIDRVAQSNKVTKETEDFMKNFSGPENAGKPIHLPPNTKIVPINQNFADAQVIETQKFARSEIGNLYGIPHFMLEHGPDSTIEQQTRQFVTFTIAPILEIYSSEIEFKLLTMLELESDKSISYDTDKLIETDTKTKTEVISMQVTKGLMTPNEGTKRLGNQPINSEWGNLHWVQTQNQPLEMYDTWKTPNDISVVKDEILNKTIKDEQSKET